MECIFPLQYPPLLCDPTVHRTWGGLDGCCHSDILHILIRDYWEKKKIMLNVKHRFMLQVGMGQGNMESEGCGLEWTLMAPL